MLFIDILHGALLVPVIFGSCYAAVLPVLVVVFRRRARHALSRPAPPPGISILKPVYGLERGLKERLRSACCQDYPDFQVVIAVQNADDPALPLVREVEAEFGPDTVTVVVHDTVLGPNGKVNNLAGALPAARHDLILISDTDIELRPDYLDTVAAPFADPQVGVVTHLFRNVGARRLYERLELLTINADFIPGVIFAEVTGAAGFCLGPSIAIRRETLAAIGGLEGLSHYLAEDFEIGRRVAESGRRVVLSPHVIEAAIELENWADWWTHQVYWDQNTRAANPTGFYGLILTKAIPFATLFCLLRGFDVAGLFVLAAAIGVRLASAAIIARSGLSDRETVSNLGLLPLRDLAGLAVWCAALGQRSVTWRGQEFVLQADGKMVPAKTRPGPV